MEKFFESLQKLKDFMNSHVNNEMQTIFNKNGIPRLENYFTWSSINSEAFVCFLFTFSASLKAKLILQEIKSLFSLFYPHQTIIILRLVLKKIISRSSLSDVWASRVQKREFLLEVLHGWKKSVGALNVFHSIASH